MSGGGMSEAPDGRRVLVVEDEGIVAKDIAAILERLGYMVPTTCQTGPEAIDATDEHRPDLVLMDIHLRGGMDGIEATQAIRERHDIPVIYLTAYADDETVRRAKATGPFAYLVKPFDEENLRTAIEVVMERNELEKRVRRHEALQSALLEAMDEGVLLVDPFKKVHAANDAAERLLGADGGLAGQTLSSFTNARAKDLALLLDKSGKSGHAVRVDVEWQVAGEKVSVTATAKPTGSGRTLLVLKDKSLEMEVEDLRTEAERLRHELEQRARDLI